MNEIDHTKEFFECLPDKQNSECLINLDSNLYNMSEMSIDPEKIFDTQSEKRMCKGMEYYTNEDESLFLMKSHQ